MEFGCKYMLKKQFSARRIESQWSSIIVTHKHRRFEESNAEADFSECSDIAKRKKSWFDLRGKCFTYKYSLITIHDVQIKI